MNKSDSIAKLSDSLAKAQGIIEGAKKDSSNPYFKSKYADLASVWDACRKPLSDNGLSVVQVFDETEKGVIVETILSHMSGEYISGRMFIPITKIDAQTIGSAATYARRYGLQAIVGIAPEDDDGNSAVSRAPDIQKDSIKKAAEYLQKKQETKKSNATSYQQKQAISKEPPSPPPLRNPISSSVSTIIEIDEGKELEILTAKEHYLDLLEQCTNTDETKEVMRKAWPNLAKFKEIKGYDLAAHDFKNAYNEKNKSFSEIGITNFQDVITKSNQFQG